MLLYFYIYFILINIAACVVCVTDKILSKTGGKQINEKAFWIIIAVGGSFMMYFTMLVIRHKTETRRFLKWLPIICFGQMFAFFAYCDLTNTSVWL